MGPSSITVGHEDITMDTVEGLRTRLQSTTDALERAKVSISHARMQYNLLWIEHQEAQNRAEVELDMAHKEVQVLCERQQPANKSMVTSMTPNARSAFPSPSDQEVAALRNRCAALQIENDKLNDRVEEMDADWSDRVKDLERENLMLRDRIRNNRNHINQIRAAGGLPSLTPSNTYATPRTGGRAALPTPSTQPGSSSKLQGHSAFDQLLLADQMLSSQEQATAPSTPTPHSRRGHGHQRGAQSLSSLPTTPLQARSVPQHPYYTPSAARTPQAPHTAPALRHRRRESRDSTISASDAGDEDANVFGSSPDTAEVVPSRASQEAASMLRKSWSTATPSGSQERREVPKSSGMLQSKLGNYAKVTKPGISGGKRKPSSSPVASQASPTKKGRGEGVGLGIGGWETRR